MSKQAILGRIRDSLQYNTLQGDSAHYTNPLKSTQEDKIQEYITLQRANKAIVIESQPSTLLQDVYNTLLEIKASKILYNPNIKDILEFSQNPTDLTKSLEFIAYDKSIDENRGELFEIDTSIVRASCAVANLGIIGIASHSLAPRLSSLITRTCLILLSKNDIVENFYQGVLSLKAQSENGKLPTNMIFIAGPSRTADIELQTVFGVHGSLKTYVILY
ncbi:LutC/YkgG family protein [Helicobacter marmotae]|uniref:Lactate utilization protein C n=1 Tax=Helicobacter marmotae TaxID=152490 RepID=A0A3D8I789_9HELI|nr:LUD domain-containing protein [Helicobacter marmotae]RDU61040.1 lactate utilization protein C [Helicobacter marmotae]